MHVTDDAMVVELLTDIPVKLVRGSYQNIKITTPEDLKIAEALCEKKKAVKEQKIEKVEKIYKIVIDTIHQ